MKHYPHHIGDFDRATRHLTRIERSVYRDMMDLYYDTETRLPLDVSFICRKIIARSNEESTAVEQVLNEFFIKTESGYWHERCEAVIEEYRNHCSQKALAGKASAAKKAAARERAINGEATAVQQPLKSVATDGNGESTNHKPETNNQSIPPLPPDGGLPQSADGVRVRGMRLPEGWGRDDSDETGLTEEVRGVARALKTGLASDWNGATVRYHFDEFEAHFRACSGRNAVKVDWLAAWRKWCSQAMREMPGRDPVRRDRLMASRRDEVRFSA